MKTPTALKDHFSSGGAVTNDLGVGVKGLTVTNLGIAGGVIKVVVLRSVAPGYTQNSVDRLSR